MPAPTGRSHVTIVVEDSRIDGPEGAGTRHDAPFHVVGVQFDQPGHQQVTVAVDGAGCVRASGIDRGDQAIAHLHRAVQSPVCQNNLAVGENSFLHVLTYLKSRVSIAWSSACAASFELASPLVSSR